MSEIADMEEEIEAMRRAYVLCGRRIGRYEETPWDHYQLMKVREGMAALLESHENWVSQKHNGPPLTQKPAWLREIK